MSWTEVKRNWLWSTSWEISVNSNWCGKDVGLDDKVVKSNEILYYLIEIQCPE